MSYLACMLEHLKWLILSLAVPSAIELASHLYSTRTIMNGRTLFHSHDGQKAMQSKHTLKVNIKKVL